MADSLAEMTDILHSLAADYSMEITPGEWRRQGPDLLAPVPAGARIYLTFLAGANFEDTVAATEGVARSGWRPVPHIAARNLEDAADLDRTVGRLAAAGATEVLVIAGSLSKARGHFDNSVEILESGVLQRHGIQRVGVAGHPEGNKDIGEAGLDKALMRKNEIAREAPFEMYLITQFAFAAQPLIDWEQRIAEAGNDLPIRIGLPGLASLSKVLKFGIACGIGASLKVLRKQTGNVLKVAAGAAYRPDQTLTGLVSSLQANPQSKIAGIHLFPFGAVESTAQWLSQVGTAELELQGTNQQLRIAV